MKIEGNSKLFTEQEEILKLLKMNLLNFFLLCFFSFFISMKSFATAGIAEWHAKTPGGNKIACCDMYNPPGTGIEYHGARSVYPVASFFFLDGYVGGGFPSSNDKFLFNEKNGEVTIFQNYNSLCSTLKNRNITLLSSYQFLPANPAISVLFSRYNIDMVVIALLMLLISSQFNLLIVKDKLNESFPIKQLVPATIILVSIHYLIFLCPSFKASNDYFWLPLVTLAISLASVLLMFAIKAAFFLFHQLLLTRNIVFHQSLFNVAGFFIFISFFSYFSMTFSFAKPDRDIALWNCVEHGDGRQLDLVDESP